MRLSLIAIICLCLDFLIAGFSYLMILENNWIINGFSLGWSFIFGFIWKLFYDFYKTGKRTS